MCCLLFFLSVILVVNVFGNEIQPEHVMMEKRLSELLYGHFGTSYHCMHNGRYIFHGQEYETSKCLKSRCFLGTSYMYSEGCEDSKGNCHKVNSVWTERCVYYKCQKTTKSGYNYYQPVIVNAQCRDVKGGCHRPGDKFSLRLEGKLHHNCQCNITDKMIYYRCVLQNSLVA